MPMMWGWNGDWGGMFLAMLLNAAVWLALICLLIWGATRLFANRALSTRRPDTGPSAIEILRQRYAHGEIDEATFGRMRQQLDITSTRDALTIPSER